MAATRGERPALIALGGFAGTGKTLLSRRLAAELRLPRLGSDTIGRTISTSEALAGRDIDGYRIAYEVLFRLCDEFLGSGVSTILDLSMGWAFQWQHLDALKRRHPEALVLPIILRCPREICIERIRRRHATDPTYYDPPDVFVTEPKLLRIWEFLARLDRPDARFIDAARSEDEVYQDVYKAVRGIAGAVE